MRTITVQASESYPIYMERGILEQCGALIRQATHANTLAVITDETVQALYGEKLTACLEQSGFSVVQFAFPHGEASKCADTLLQIYAFLVEHHITRTDCLVALGGGVVGDITGFAAATYLRGVDYIQIPTTLLAQIDSSVGGKTAIDLPSGKNLVGAFKQPNCVICDPATLETLPPAFVSDGMGEAIKYGMIWDAKLFDQIASHTLETLPEILEDMIYTCIDIKRQVVEADEFDTGKRMILNYGHTLGHAIESYYHYQTYSHGSAVAIGMCLMAQRTCPKNVLERLVQCVEQYHLPSSVPVPMQELVAHCGKDKKCAGATIRFIVCETIGKAEIRTMDLDAFAAFMEEQ